MELLCERIAAWCKMNSTVSEEDYPIVVYGIQVLFNTSFKVAGILLAGLILHRFFAVLIGTIVFCSMRYWTGGWHSKSHLGCFCSMLIACVLPAFFIGTGGKEISWVLGCMLIYSVYKILRYAPCNSKENPIYDVKVMKIKRIGSVTEALALSVMAVMLRKSGLELLITIPLFMDALLLNCNLERIRVFCKRIK